METIHWTSFGAGVGVGVAAAAVGSRAWRATRRYQQRETQARQTYSIRGADPGYMRALVQHARHAHSFGHRLALHEIFVPPRFLPLPELPAPGEDDDSMGDSFDSIPQFPAYPALHAAFPLRTLSYEDIGRSTHPLAILGDIGSGRTTALLGLALWSAGFLELPETQDAVERQIELQDSELPTREQAARIKQRLAQAEAARKRSLGEDSTTAEEQEKHARLRVPLYVHFATMMPFLESRSARLDPAEPLVEGLRQQPGWLSAKRMVGRSYKLLETGRALLLLDGYDELPPAQQSLALDWLRAFLELYPTNQPVIALPLGTETMLMDMGIVPLFLQPWHDQQLQHSTQQWQQHWRRFGEKRLHVDRERFKHEDDFVRSVAHRARSMNAFEASLHIWTEYSGQPGNQSEQMQRYLQELMPDVQALLPDLRELAVLQLDEGYFTLEDWVDLALDRQAQENAPEEASEERSEDSPPTPIAPEDLDDFYGHVIQQAPETREVQTQATSPVLLEDDDETLDKKLLRELTRQQTQRLKKLRQAGLIVRYPGGRYQFRHRYVAAYLAALSLANASEDMIRQKYEQPAWREAFGYLLQQRDLEFLVQEQLTRKPDVLHETHLSLTRLLPYAAEDMPWRNDLLRRLGHILVEEPQYTLLRQRTAAALVNSRDPGAIVIFRHALQSQNATLRQLACWGLGVLRDTAVVDALTKIVIQDPSLNVRIAAGMSLGVIGTHEAFLSMTDAFEITNDTPVQRVLAECMTAYPEEGYLALATALQSDDYMTRRSAVFALGRIPKDWALITLNDMLLEDDEWYVRSAAEGVFQQMHHDSLRRLQPYPRSEALPWLRNWAHNNLDLDEWFEGNEEIDFVQQAIAQDEDKMIRFYALQAAGLLGLHSTVPHLYNALCDPEENHRDAAYTSLGYMQQRSGHMLPVPG